MIDRRELTFGDREVDVEVGGIVFGYEVWKAVPPVGLSHANLDNYATHFYRPRGGFREGPISRGVRGIELPYYSRLWEDAMLIIREGAGWSQEQKKEFWQELRARVEERHSGIGDDCWFVTVPIDVCYAALAVLEVK